MSTPINPSESDNVYFNDPESGAEMARLIDQDHLITKGMGGLFAYLAFLFAAVRMGWKCWKQNDGYLSMLALGITAAIIGQIVHMNFDVFRIGPVPELLWLLAALLVPMHRIGAGVPAGRP